MQVQEKCNIEFKSCKPKEHVNKSEKELSSKILKQINNIIQREGYIRCVIESKQIPTLGGSFLGDLYEIDIRGKTAEGHREINLFIKNMFLVEKNSFIPVRDMYDREIFIYEEISIVFQDLQDEAKVPETERYNMVKHYGIIPQETLIMENMRLKGFKVADRMDCISLQFAEIAIQTLAKFHSLTFVAKERRPDFYENKMKLKYITRKTDDFEDFIKGMLKHALDSIESADVRKKLEKYGENLTDNYLQYYSESTYNVLCHGDYRINNILMKEMDGIVTDVIPVDFQIIYYGCPVNDFLYFVFGSTDYEFRRKHMTHLKDLYHSTMASFLRYFEINVEDHYPKRQFEQDFDSRLDFGLMTMIILLPFFLASTEDAPHLGKDDITAICSPDNQLCKIKLREVVNEFIHYGFL